MEDQNQFLRPGATVESGHPRIRSLAQEIAAGAEDPTEVASRLFLWVRENILYSVQVPFHRLDDYRASVVIDRGRGYCVQKAVVLCALARAADIPARLVFADIVNHLAPRKLTDQLGSNLFVYHCYTGMYLAGRWLHATPAFHRALCEEHGYPLLQFDGYSDAIFPPTNAQGDPFVDYVQHHGTHFDVPLDQMLARWVEAYGEVRVDQWRELFS